MAARRTLAREVGALALEVLHDLADLRRAYVARHALVAVQAVGAGERRDVLGAVRVHARRALAGRQSVRGGASESRAGFVLAVRAAGALRAAARAQNVILAQNRLRGVGHVRVRLRSVRSAAQEGRGVEAAQRVGGGRSAVVVRRAARSARVERAVVGAHALGAQRGARRPGPGRLVGAALGRVAAPPPAAVAAHERAGAHGATRAPAAAAHRAQLLVCHREDPALARASAAQVGARSRVQTVPPGEGRRGGQRGGAGFVVGQHVESSGGGAGRRGEFGAGDGAGAGLEDLLDSAEGVQSAARRRGRGVRVAQQHDVREAVQARETRRSGGARPRAERPGRAMSGARPRAERPGRAVSGSAPRAGLPPRRAPLQFR